MDSSAAGTPIADERTAPRRAADPWPPRSAANRTELDPVSFLRRSASLHPDRTAVVHGELRRAYEELDARVSRLASALRARGLGRRDRVAVLSPNAPALLEAHFGCRPPAACSSRSTRG
jgi:acyl-CoA synthetase (AMP-forming)/AMP-acid ligase II